uniref:50S ribosomal protein L16 n=1 Tax=Nephromyces sp. ex Molgula occidentalis TaxID=2544991 RepID=A0A5C1H8G8_9APIC|nr:50S ribosomal protein L16 [Nephromyces sp. ex Molgula occidentalis]
MILKYFHLKKNKGKSFKKPILYFGDWGIQALSNCILTDIHLNLIKKFFNNNLKKICKIYFRINLNKIKTKKPFDSRMGAGKGEFKNYVSKIKKGDILFELNILPNNIIINYIKLLSYKLPLKIRIIYKYNKKFFNAKNI